MTFAFIAQKFKSNINLILLFLNIILFSENQVERLIGSYLPEIRPHFPLSITFCLSLFGMAFKKREDSNMSVDCVLKKSFWNFNYPSKVSQVQYDALFGLNFLMDLLVYYLLNQQQCNLSSYFFISICNSSLTAVLTLVWAIVMC